MKDLHGLYYNPCMIITIEDKQFETKEITQLYPAAIVKTGYENETTQVSLEWLSVESKGKVEVVGFGIFVHVGENERYEFIYETREEMDTLAAKIASQLK